MLQFRATGLGAYLLLGACIVMAGAAGAASPEAEQPPLWELRFAAFGRYAPVYPGSGEHDLNILPLPYPVYRGKRLRFGEDFDAFAEGRVARGPRARLDINFNVNFGEDSQQIPVRRGMPDLDLLIEVGPELEVKLNNRPATQGEWLLALQARAGLSVDGSGAEGQGFLFNPELEYRIHQAFGTRNDWSFRFTPTWVTEDYADYYYEVAPKFATANRPAFNGSSGYLGSEVRIGLERQITKRLRFDGSARVWFNHGARNRRSPLFEDNLSLGVQAAFIWTLAASDRPGR